MMDLGEFAFGIILNLVTDVIEKTIDVSVLEFLERRRITRRVEDAVANIVEPLIPFLKQEKISEEKQQRLLQTCVDELRPLSQEPERLFQGSLNGQKIFDNLYAGRSLPQVVIEDGVKEVYILLCPRVAEILCKVPAAMKEWETLAWADNYRRLDDLVSQLRALFNKVDALERKTENVADETLNRVRRSLTQRIGLEMDITGLRADQPQSGKLAEFFVHPAIQEMIPNPQGNPKVLTNAADVFAQFIGPDHKNVIIGVGGAGKSTWSKWLQRETLNVEAGGFGVRVELRAYSNKPLPSLHDLVRETAGVHLAEELTNEVIARWLEGQMLVFILDGFDEVALSERETVYDWMTALRLAARRCPIILTSRPLTTDHLERTDLFNARWSMEPFDEPRIIEYIGRWYAHAPLLPDAERAVDAEGLAAQWQGDPTLAPLTGNPLLLSTLLMVHHLDGHLPNGRSQLYRRYIDGMLGLWDDRRKLAHAISLTQPQKRQIIRALALTMFLREQDQLDETELLDWLGSFLKEANIAHTAQDVLTVLRERSGLIVGPGAYNFAHKSIAEYLVAEIVWDGDQKDLTGQRIDRMYLFEQRDNDRWNSVLFFWAGLAAVADLVAFIDSCLDVENWALAYGLLYDQYSRIQDRETRRRLLLPDLGGRQISFANSASITMGQIFTEYGMKGSPSFTKIFYPTMVLDLRGVVVRNIGYWGLASFAWEHGDLTFEDGLTAQIKELVHFIWFWQLDDVSDDMDGLSKCLVVEYPIFRSYEERAICILHFLFTRALRSDDDNDFELAIEKCHTFLPAYTGLLPMFLMSDCLRGFLSNDRKKRCLAFLPDFGRGKSYPVWLLGTKNWRFYGTFEELEQFDELGDLFQMFRKEMNSLHRRGVLPRDAVFKRAMQYVDELEAQRAALAAEMGIDLEAGPYVPESE